MQCPRCSGLIILPAHYSDDDPKCSSCARLFPKLAPSTPNNNGRVGSRHGLRDTIRYTGSTESLKGITCVIHYKPHPSANVSYPLLEVSCPWCNKIAEVADGLTNPAAAGYREHTRYKSKRAGLAEARGVRRRAAQIGENYVRCPTGHMFRLKISSEGIYSWE